MSIIALATDFGEGVYAGAMKAVIVSRCPSCRIVDLFHSVSPQSVLEGAFLLSRSWEFFPEKTIFAAVVDPGVGSERKILAVRAHRRIFLAPDNGLLSFIPAADVDEIRLVENSKLFLPRVSATFHGRDIFAPVAAALAKGVSFRRLGRAAKDFVRLKDLYPSRSPKGMDGKIVHVDRFGNAVTNLNTATNPRSITVSRTRIATVVRTYADALNGRPVIVRGSFNTWEIAVRNGSAAGQLSLRVGLPARQEL